MASYLGTSCSQGATVYNWLSYSCASTPASICDALGPNGESVSMKMDPNGPSTILVGGSAHLYVTAGQSVDLIVAGTIYGSTRNLNWPHFQQAGQTGDGTEENITTVGCAATGDCLDANAGVCDILCSATSPTANCTEQQHDVFYEGYGAHFNAAPPDAPYSLSIEMKLSGNSGTASLRSVGTHL